VRLAGAYNCFIGQPLSSKPSTRIPFLPVTAIHTPQRPPKSWQKPGGIPAHLFWLCPSRLLNSEYMQRVHDVWLSARAAHRYAMSRRLAAQKGGRFHYRSSNSVTVTVTPITGLESFPCVDDTADGHPQRGQEAID
jgi:hypothetical protein